MVVLAALLIGAIVELYVFVQVAGAIGFLNALGLVILLSLIGAWLAKRQGVAVWRRAQQQMANRRVPTAHLTDAFIVLLAGILLLVPGFVSGAIGLLLLLPPIRMVVRRLLIGRWSDKISLIKATYRGPIDTTATDTTATDATNYPQLPRS
jgi:UPF0716 protein FxsA